MQTVEIYPDGVICYTKYALKKMRIRSSLLGRRMVEANFPIPETSQDIEHYVQKLFTPKEYRAHSM